MVFCSHQQRRRLSLSHEIENFLYLRSKGYNIFSIGVDNPGIEDHAVMSLAIMEGRTILTFDRDYGELIFKHNFKPKNGVIYFRLDKYKADEPGKILEDLINKKEFDFESALTVVDKNRIRQRIY